MRSLLAELREFLEIAAEALGRYKLRTALSVLGVVLGVAAVIAMMSVSDGARLEALTQIDALGLDNLVARGHGSTIFGGPPHGLTAGDADRLPSLVPLVDASSPLIERYHRLTHAEKSIANARVLGVSASYQQILRLGVDNGRFLSVADERASATVIVLGAGIAEQLFGYQDPVGQRVRVGQNYYQVIGVLRRLGVNPQAAGSLAWRDINDVALVPLPTLSGRTLDVAPNQPADEVWLQVADGDHVDTVAKVFEHTLERLRGSHQDFDVIVPRELLAQRYRTQRTFSVVVGSVAAMALIVGGIGIMNIMLTSVVERTHEIGIRRTVGATRRHVTGQFLVEALLMTLGGGAAGILLGIGVSWGITAYAGWRTHVSTVAVGLSFAVSLLTGLVFGIYPAIKAAQLEPVDAVRYE